MPSTVESRHQCIMPPCLISCSPPGSRRDVVENFMRVQSCRLDGVMRKHDWKLEIIWYLFFTLNHGEGTLQPATRASKCKRSREDVQIRFPPSPNTCTRTQKSINSTWCILVVLHEISFTTSTMRSLSDRRTHVACLSYMRSSLSS